MVAPEKGLGSSSGCPLYEFSVIGRFYLFGGAAEHGEDGEADGADGECWTPLCVVVLVPS